MDKETEYAAKLYEQIIAIFDEDSENHIDRSELSDSENAKKFFHALSTMMPCVLYGKLTGDNVDNLKFNHIANHLCFEYVKIID